MKTMTALLLIFLILGQSVLFGQFMTKPQLNKIATSEAKVVKYFLDVKHDDNFKLVDQDRFINAYTTYAKEVLVYISSLDGISTQQQLYKDFLQKTRDKLILEIYRIAILKYNAEIEGLIYIKELGKANELEAEKQKVIAQQIHNILNEVNMFLYGELKANKILMSDITSDFLMSRDFDINKNMLYDMLNKQEK